MNRIFVDLEMNRIWNRIPDTKVNCEMEIIQIGAVKLDESAREIDCFDEYVKPVCSDSMDRNIERITGIHFNMLAGKEPIEIVLTRFVEWCGKDYEIYSWSETDAHQLVRETGYKGIRDTEGLRYMYCQWHDYQAEFCDTLGLSQRPALEKAVNIAGIEYSGKPHNGLADARTTAALYRLTKNEKKLAKLRKTVRELDSPRHFTMADMFDFSNIKLSE